VEVEEGAVVGSVVIDVGTVELSVPSPGSFISSVFGTIMNTSLISIKETYGRIVAYTLLGSELSKLSITPIGIPAGNKPPSPLVTSSSPSFRTILDGIRVTRHKPSFFNDVNKLRV